MVWKDKEPYDDAEVKFDQDVFDFYQRAIAIREVFPPLQTGMFRPIVTDDEHGVIAFARELNGKAVYVAINRSDKDQTVRLKLNDQDADAMFTGFRCNTPRTCRKSIALLYRHLALR